MTAYEQGLPVHVAFTKPPPMVNIAGQYLSDLGLRQFRCAETEKYPHVTFFFNDYREEPFPGEERGLVPSPLVSTYDRKPEMSAYEVTELMRDRIASEVEDLIVLNYANPDMVGHSGSLEAYDVPLYVYGEPFKGTKLRDSGRLADIMPTTLTMMGLDVPPEMTGRSLIV